MSGNELYEPLTGNPSGRGRRRAVGAWVSVCAAVPLLVVGSVLAIRDDGGRGGEPQAIATIERQAPAALAMLAAPPSIAGNAPAPAATGAVAPGPPGGGAEPAAHAGQSVEVQNGVKIYRPILGTSPGMTVMKVPQQGETDAVPFGAPDGQRIAPDVRVVEPGPYGPLPRIGQDGTRPAEVYARPPSADGPGDPSPKLALLIGGLGFERAATARAAADLPGAVTFGFTPYGPDLAAQVRAARGAGHEIVLQLPMEGFGRNEPPPTRMLTVEADKTPDSLLWLLSRFPGYAGVSNLLGGRILASEAALRPVAEGIAARGLYFLEDGTASQSRLDPIARETGLASARADVVIDARSDAATIDQDLARLESLARSRGTAIGTAIASPGTSQAVARFAASLAARGVTLIPLSQAIRARRAMGTAGLASSR